MSCAALLRAGTSFNPRPRAGGDGLVRLGPERMTGRTCFNPRPRAGGDADRTAGRGV